MLGRLVGDLKTEVARASEEEVGKVFSFQSGEGNTESACFLLALRNKVFF